MIPVCPNCGVRSWKVPAAVEIEITVDEHAIASVVAEPTIMHGEGDPCCTGCGELLLDWSAWREDDGAWDAHHDERRPAWDELHLTTREMLLPALDRWCVKAVDDA